MNLQVAIPHDRMFGVININGNDCPVTHLFGKNGDELLSNDSGAKEILAVVALLPNGQWLALEAGNRDLGPLQ